MNSRAIFSIIAKSMYEGERELDGYYTALLLDECRRSQFYGSVMQVGRHTIYLTMDSFAELAVVHGVKLKEVSQTLSNFAPVAKSGGISDTTFFSSLGLEPIESWDISDCDAATYILDLNKPAPELLHNKYDLIIDSGTVEHIFDLPQVLRNLHSMLNALFSCLRLQQTM